MALTLEEFLSIYTKNDPLGGRILKVTTTGGVTDPNEYLTKSDPLGGRFIKVEVAGGGGGGGLTNWTEAYTSNAFGNSSSFTALGAGANINAAIIPKGTGAITADIADGSTGGNNRGTYAVDFQMVRSSATQVASGIYAVICGGQNNSVSGSFSVVSGGSTNEVTATQSNINGGAANTITSIYSVIGGGNANSAIGGAGYQVIGGGSQNTVSNNYATIAGGYLNQVAGSSGFIGGGVANRAGGENSTVAGGYICYANGQRDAVVGGESNQLLLTGAGGETHRFIGGGLENAIAAGSTNYSGIMCGRENRVASGAGYSAVLGGYQANAYFYGQKAHANGRFTITGDAQGSEAIYRLNSGFTQSQTKEIFLDGTAVRITPPTNSAMTINFDIVAVVTSISGTATGVNVGDMFSQNTIVAVKNVAGTTSVVNFHSIHKLHDASMTSCDTGYLPTGTALTVNFLGPNFSGGGTVNLRIVVKARIVETRY